MRAITSLSILFVLTALAVLGFAFRSGHATRSQARNYYLDVHELGPGSVTAEAVAEAHRKDLEVQDRFDTRFLKYWVDEAQGRVYCLSEAPSPDAITETHRAAHGLLPSSIHEVSEGEEAEIQGGTRLYLDLHRLGPGAVTAEAVANAHLADLATQDRYAVNFINYWVDEDEGLVWCLAEAPSAEAMSRTHEEAHGLVPDEIMEVAQGE